MHPFMKIDLHPPHSILAAFVATAACLPDADVQARSADPFPSTYADPALPLLQLPRNFRARRTTANLALMKGTKRLALTWLDDRVMP